MTALETPPEQCSDGALTATNGCPDRNPSLTFPDLLEALDYRDSERISVCYQPVGGDFGVLGIVPVTDAARLAASVGDTGDVWFGVNPTSATEGRGDAAHTTRLVALYADLDVKPGGCADLPTAEKIIDDVSAHVGQRPTVVVYSGHGLQPQWAIDDGEIGGPFGVVEARALLGRFRRLCDVVADQYGARVDAVFDPARVLRVPMTLNLKDVPVRVTGRRDTGGPLTVTEVDERLTELGIDARLDDAAAAESVSNPNDWRFAEQTCAYVAKWLDGLATDGPQPGGGRNPWVCSQAVRLCCAWRLGCITRDDFGRAIALLEGRLATLLATTEQRRPLKRLEMRDAFTLGRKRAAEKTDEQARDELKNHRHTGGAEDFWGTGQPVANVPAEPVAVAVVDEAPAVDTVPPPPTTWEPIDLWPYLRGEIELPEPSVGIARRDGLRMLYAGREHAVIGETESGKTWFALACVAIALQLGQTVVYVHFEEGDPSSTIERLGLLGVTSAVMAEHLRFVAPSLGLRDVTQFAALLAEPVPVLVVLDGVNEGMALHGLEIFAAEGAAMFRRLLVSPALRAGAAVLSCDHLPKSRDGQGRDAYGSVHKGNAIDGARFVLENVTPFGRGMRGASNVFVTKDRPGYLRGHGRPSRLAGKTFMGTLVADDENSHEPFSLVLYAPKDAGDDGPTESAPAPLADAVFDVIAARPDRTVPSSRELFAAMRAAGHSAQDDAIRDAVADLVVAERVAEVKGNRGAKGYRAVATASRGEIS